MKKGDRIRMLGGMSPYYSVGDIATVIYAPMPDDLKCDFNDNPNVHGTGEWFIAGTTYEVIEIYRPNAVKAVT